MHLHLINKWSKAIRINYAFIGTECIETTFNLKGISSMLQDCIGFADIHGIDSKLLKSVLASLKRNKNCFEAIVNICGKQQRFGIQYIEFVFTL